ncbi:hypothetical protein ACOSQ3_012621 [Xanthoceras sorbifolium]
MPSKNPSFSPNRCRFGGALSRFLFPEFYFFFFSLCFLIGFEICCRANSSWSYRFGEISNNINSATDNFKVVVCDMGHIIEFPSGL